LQLRPTWDKEQAGLVEVEAHLHETRPAPGGVRGEAAAAMAPAPSMDMERTVDPNAQGDLLMVVHKATVESEEIGRQFLQVLENEIEPAIKELSSALLYPDTSASELDQCVQKFEAAIGRMQSAQKVLHLSVERVHALGDKLFK
jgi:hypothetical protein